MSLLRLLLRVLTMKRTRDELETRLEWLEAENAALTIRCAKLKKMHEARCRAVLGRALERNMLATVLRLFVDWHTRSPEGVHAAYCTDQPGACTCGIVTLIESAQDVLAEVP